MRALILLLLATLCGYGALQLGKLDPDNYVKMYVGNVVVEVKLLGFLLLVIALVVVLYATIKLFRMLWKAPKSYANWAQRHHTQTANADLGAGYLAMVKGDWKRAEKRLTQHPQDGSVPYLNYLVAAQAAQEQGKHNDRDHYLNAAYQAAPKERLAIGLTKARLHQQAGQLENALATLQDLSEEGQKNAQYTAMLIQTHQQMGDWQAMQALLPKARKQKALSDESLSTLSDELYHGALKTAKDMKAVWASLPREQKKQINNVIVYAYFLSTNGESLAAEKLIRSTLKTDWSDDLVRLYGKLETGSPAKQRRHVEGWLLARPENPELNLAAGRLAFAEKKFDIAETFLKQSIGHGQLPKAYSLLGEVYEAANESSKALHLYRSGMLAVAQKAEAIRMHDSGMSIPSADAAPAAISEQEEPVAKEGELVKADLKAEQTVDQSRA